jgi:hypothetical protein
MEGDVDSERDGEPRTGKLTVGDDFDTVVLPDTDT